MRNLHLTSFSSLLVCLAASGCIGLDGNGKRVDETRRLADFTRIENNGPFDLEVIQSDEFEVRVSVDSNLLHELDTDFTSITLSGSGDIELFGAVDRGSLLFDRAVRSPRTCRG